MRLAGPARLPAPRWRVWQAGPEGVGHRCRVRREFRIGQPVWVRENGTEITELRMALLVSRPVEGLVQRRGSPRSSAASVATSCIKIAMPTAFADDQIVTLW